MCALILVIAMVCVFVNAIAAAKNWHDGRPRWAGFHGAGVIFSVLWFLGASS